MKKLLYIFLFLPILALAQQPRANQIRVTPTGSVSATDLQSVITEMDNEKSGKNITWITKTSTYTPTALDTLLSPVGYSFQSVTDLSFTIPPFTSTNFKRGTTFRIRNDSTNTVSILEGSAVSIKCQSAGPWTLEEDEEAEISKINTTNTWLLKLFKKPNLSTSTIVPIYTEFSTVGNVTTGEDVLFTDTLDANTMSTNGNIVSGRFSGIVANNANGKDIRLSFGSTDIVSRHTTTPTVGQGWVLDWQCIRVDANNQKCNGTFTGSDGVASAFYVATTEDLTQDVIITLTGEATSTNDIVKHTASGNFAPGAGSGNPPPPITPPEIPFVIVDNATRGAQGYQWNYVSTWATPGTGIAGWYNETLDYTGTTNAYAEITFNGTRIQLYTEKKNTHGIFEVSLDGVVVDTVDLYSSTQLLQQLVFDTNDANDPDHEEGPLTQAVHTLKLRCTGTKNASSSAYYLIVDYVRIENPQEVPVDEIPDPPATATDFVALTGSDGGGNNCNSAGSPCRTIVYALTQMSSGDKLSVGPGTFTETSFIVVGAGKSIQGAGVDQTIIKVSTSLNYNANSGSNPVTLGGIDQTKCILQYTAASSTAQTLSELSIEGNSKGIHGGIFIDTDRNNVALLNVKVSNCDYFGIHVGGNDNTLTNVQIINSAAAGTNFSTGNLLWAASDGVICDNVDISDNLEGYGIKAWGAGAIIESPVYKNSEIRVIPNSPYGGGGIPNIALEWHNCKPRHGLIENNYFDNAVSLVRPTGFADDGIPSVDVNNNTFDMITKGGGNAINVPIETGVHNLTVRNNHFVGGKYAYIVHWNAVESGAAVNQVIHHNTFYCVGHVNSPTGIFRSSYAPWNGVYFYNNVIHIPPSNNYMTCIAFTGCCGSGRNSTNVNIKNNVIYDQSTADTGVGGANAITRIEGSGGSWASSTFTYNTVVGMSTTLPSGWTASNTLTTGPNFTGSGGVNPSPFVYDPFYRPAAGSPLLNSGIDVGLGDGATPDRGRIQVP